MTDAVDIITLAEAKSHLNMSTTDNDTELASFITAASQMWVNRVGPVNSTAYDEWYDGGAPTIALRNFPVVSVSAVTEHYGAALQYTLTLQTLETGGDTSAWGYSIETSTGQLTRRAAGIAVPFSGGERNIHVIYYAGRSAVPEDIKLAVKLLVAHMWTTQRGGTRRPGIGGTADEAWQPHMSFTWPHRVEEIAAGYRVPGIA